MAQLHRLLPGISWSMIEVQAQLGSAILSRQSFLDLYEAYVDKL